MLPIYSRIERWSGGTAIICLCLLPLILYGGLAVRSENASVHDWLPQTRPERIAYDQFVEQFGEDQFVLVSWEGARIDDPRLPEVKQALVEVDRHSQGFFSRVETTTSIVETLTANPINLNRLTALSRIRGFMVGEDGTACCLLALTPAGVAASAETIEMIESAVTETTGLPRNQVYIVGTLFEEVAVDQAGQRDLRWLLPPSTLAAILVAICSLTRVRECLVVFLLAGLGQGMAVALIYYTGGRFSAVLIVLPTLVFMLSLSAAIHLINYLHDVSQKNTTHLGARALLLGLRPSALASTTTILGMCSLVVSELAPVRNFGLYAAGALAIATCALLSLFPWLTQRLLPKAPPAMSDAPNRHAQTRATWDARLTSLATAVHRHAIPIAILGCVALGLAAFGLTGLRASTKFDRMFSPKSSVISGMRWVEQHIGPIVSIEVLLDFRQPNAAQNEASVVQRLRWISTIQTGLQELPDVGATLSAASFLPTPASETGIRATAQRSVFNAALRQQIPVLQEQGWIVSDKEYQRWRITCKVSSLQDEDYGIFVDRIRAATQQMLDLHADQPHAPERFSITGLSPIIHEAQLMLLSDLGNSFLMAFLLITPAMMLITRSLFVGALVMIPNVLPVAMVFGCMGLMGVRLDIAGILTASIALGIAVDDTLHFVSWYARAKQAGESTATAILCGYRRCGLAMIETTLISCAAMLPFLFSEFTPTRHFATLMMLMLLGAIVGDLLLLPALLASYERFANTSKLKA